jgi:excinuclease ABC subunit C
VKRIKETDIQALTGILGASKAQIIYDYFHTNKGLELKETEAK